MRYSKITTGTFIDRPNRFIAHINIEGNIETVHIKNTGRCKELLLPGSKVILEDFRNRPAFENRKTKFDLIAVYKKIEQKNPLHAKIGSEILINMDSQAPNKIVHEWLLSQNTYDCIKPEYTYGNSRVDFYMEKKISVDGHPKIQKYLMEVKGCTLERNGQGYFPDAPTERGVKHLHELTEASKHGYRCVLAFVIQVPGVKTVLPNTETHPEFGAALQTAKDAGVEVLFLKCRIKEDEIVIIQN